MVMADPEWESLVRSLDGDSDGDQMWECVDIGTIEAAGAVDGSGTVERTNLPADFWRARPVLAHIRAAAHARARSADAVLGVVLARIAVQVPPTLTLPATVGAPATLDVIHALIGRSGSGKSSSAEVAAELVPIHAEDIVTIPLGSGEGIVESYLAWVDEVDPDTGKTRRVKRQVRRGLLGTVDEGQALADMGRRSGSTLMPTLRTAWSGGTLGQANASEERHRIVAAREYRCAVIVGFQLDHATALIEDEAGGTPQRVCWFAAEDPSIPDDAPEWPGPIEWQMPTHPVGPMRLAAEVAAEIRGRSLAVSRGRLTLPPLDAHRDLVRLKVAGLLALLDYGLDVSVEDWELAGQVLNASDRVRSMVVDAAADRSRGVALARRLAKVEDAAAVDDDAKRRAIESMAASIARHVRRHEGTCVRRCVTQSTAGKHRQLASVDEAIDLAESRLWVVVDGAEIAPGKRQP